MRNRSGFTFIEVLIATGMMGAIIMGGLSLNNYMVTVTQYSDRRNNLSSLENIITERINDPALCSWTLGSNSGQNNPGQSNRPIKLKIPNIRAGAAQSSSVIGTGIVIPSIHLELTLLELRDVRQIDATPRFVGHIFIGAKDEAGRAYHESLMAPVIFTVDAGGSIFDCHSNEMLNSQDVCGAMGCQYHQDQTPMCNCLPVPLTPCTGTWAYPVYYNNMAQPIDENGNSTCRALTASCPDDGSYVTGVSLSGGHCGSLPRPTSPPAGP